MRRLFNAHVQLVYEDECSEATVNALIARRTEFWWNPKRPDESTLWKSKLELSEDFFNEIIRHPVPLDLNTLTALKRSTLGLDLYLWLVYRTFALRASLRLSWRAGVPSVRCGPGTGGRQEYRERLSDKVPP